MSSSKPRFQFSLRTMMSITALIAVGTEISQFLFLYPQVLAVMLETMPILLLASLICGAFYLEDNPKAFCMGAAIFYGIPCIAIWLPIPGHGTFQDLKWYFYNAIVYPRYEVTDLFIVIPGIFMSLFYVTCGGYAGIFMRRIGIAQKKRREALERDGNVGDAT